MHGLPSNPEPHACLQVASHKDKQTDEYGLLHATGIHCTGRIILNLWRILRQETKLAIYTFESCVAHVLQLRVPHIPCYQLAQWFTGGAAGALVHRKAAVACPCGLVHWI